MSRALSHAVRRSGLPSRWDRDYECLRGPGRAEAAVEHVTATINTLPRAYRIGFLLGLSALRVLNRLGAGATADRLPGFAQVLRVTTALALQGALDGVPKEGVR